MNNPFVTYQKLQAGNEKDFHDLVLVFNDVFDIGELILINSICKRNTNPLSFLRRIGVFLLDFFREDCCYCATNGDFESFCQSCVSNR